MEVIKNETPQTEPKIIMDDVAPTYAFPVKDANNLLTHFSEYLDRLKQLYSKLQFVIGNKIFKDELEECRLYVEALEVKAKIDVQTKHVEVLTTRLDMLLDDFEKRSAEANTGWNRVWELAVDIAKKYPLSSIFTCVDSYSKLSPKDINQEMKVETYYYLKQQINSYNEKLRQVEDAKKKLELQEKNNKKIKGK